jgi:hypothetical protein
MKTDYIIDPQHSWSLLVIRLPLIHCRQVGQDGSVSVLLAREPHVLAFVFLRSLNFQFV